ncbi:hypothetical protein [Nocardioides phosphati]|uniref:hypothetical protein n=1 Tax=Nocardioides phosphati TaxID=1867775 RepID=UPI001669878D|nr:hypothetical protein [Nocardioides phosphati]
MSLPVPLTVRVGTRHITNEVAGLQIRKEAVGGVKSIALRLARPLDKFDANLDLLEHVTIYDARSAEIIADGDLTDQGRGTDGSGQVWDMVAFGPAQCASDITFPYVVVDQATTQFVRSSASSKSATTNTSEINANTPSLEVVADEGKTISTTWLGDWVYRALYQSRQKLARISVVMDAGVNGADWHQMVVTRNTPTGGGNAAVDIGASTTSSTRTGVVVTNFPNGDDIVSVRCARQTTSTTGGTNTWFGFSQIKIRALLKSATGVDLLSGYTTNTVVAHQVVNDLLGRILSRFDGASAVVSTEGVYTIDQLAYVDGTTAEQVLNDLMALEPAFRWTTSADTGNGYGFRWEAWPTTVRYEATLDDGGSFPVSAQDLYNEVTVRWVRADGFVRQVLRTGACPILDDKGITRRAIIDLSDEVGSVAAAEKAGDNFLDEHRAPKNSGTLTVSRRIRDLATGRMVEPFEIEPGELIRVRGVESYPDALNASSNDGLTVFRIWSATYNSDSHSVELELDADARTTANALRKLLKRRDRRR